LALLHPPRGSEWPEQEPVGQTQLAGGFPLLAPFSAMPSVCSRGGKEGERTRKQLLCNFWLYNQKEGIVTSSIKKLANFSPNWPSIHSIANLSLPIENAASYIHC